jgi:hypothetical protein
VQDALVRQISCYLVFHELLKYRLTIGAESCRLRRADNVLQGTQFPDLPVRRTIQHIKARGHSSRPQMLQQFRVIQRATSANIDKN